MFTIYWIRVKEKSDSKDLFGIFREGFIQILPSMLRVGMASSKNIPSRSIGTRFDIDHTTRSLGKVSFPDLYFAAKIYEKPSMKITPMMQQFFDAKNRFPDAILFFRMGDFYEMFFEDAEEVSRVLGLTLTARHKGEKHETPMAGVPHHAAAGYINRLIAQGYSVAICEQLENPADVKGIVKRDVVRVVTPGMVYDTETIDAKSANFVAAIERTQSGFLALAFLDLSTGVFRTTLVADEEHLATELFRLEPKEVLSQGEQFKSVIARINAFHRSRDVKSFSEKELLSKISKGVRLSEHMDYDGYFLDAKGVESLLKQCEKDVKGAVSTLLHFVVETYRGIPTHVSQISYYDSDAFLVIDDATKANLELTETLMGGKRIGSLLHIIDKTTTAQGGRLLRTWLNYPLKNPIEINKRLDVVDCFTKNLVVRQDLKVALDSVYDLQRLCGKIASGTSNAKDVRALWKTFSVIPDLVSCFTELQVEGLEELRSMIDPHSDLCAKIDAAIVDEPTGKLTEGGLFKRGFDAELDRILELAENGKDWILNYEAEQRASTGISKLKLKYNKVFGYFIEVTKSYVSQVPENYIRKQTLKNCERYFTLELKEMEDSIVGATHKRCDVEYAFFEKLRKEISALIPSIRITAAAIAELDVLVSFAELAERNDYSRPTLNATMELSIQEGRHPVVERNLDGDRFVPNDSYLDDAIFLQVITGPNMAGKSTIIRQVALIVLLAQMGSFVPASSATIGVVDKIFSRVGASDNLARGHSTFMVEMTETAHILKNATERSFIVLDEIGRGTSTFDGLSIAWAVVEYLHNIIGARTMFATHYHELSALIDILEHGENMSVSVKEYNDQIIFLRRLVKGQTNRSYGVQVAKLAGLPDEVVERAKEILQRLEDGQLSEMGIDIASASSKTENQLSLFGAVQARSDAPIKTAELAILKELKALNENAMTPMDALSKLSEWRQNLEMQ